MSLGNFMHSPVGFGVYGDLLDIVKSGAAGLVKGAVGQVAGQVEVTTPAALAGAKLTGGFKIIEEGDSYKIILDSDLPGLSSFTGLVITGKDPIKETLANLELEYTPPPTNYVPFIIGGAIAIAAVAFFLTRKDATPASARRRKSKKRRRR